MPDGFISPYGITLQEDGIMSVFPVIEAQIASKNGEWLSFFLVVDSGATISALPKTDAPPLGINAESGQQVNVAGIGKVLVRGWRHEIPVRLGNQILRLPVTFLDSISAPRILGRAGVFDSFTVIFEESRRRSAFLPKSSKEARKVGILLDTL